MDELQLSPLHLFSNSKCVEILFFPKKISFHSQTYMLTLILSIVHLIGEHWNEIMTMASTAKQNQIRVQHRHSTLEHTWRGKWGLRNLAPCSLVGHLNKSFKPNNSFGYYNLASHQSTISNMRSLCFC